jgi:uncharacterized damage-inducible protein DinB
MVEVLQKQYRLVKMSREAVFTFIETRVGDDLNTPVAVYVDKSIHYLLEHTASCYINWLAYFALQQPTGSGKDQGFPTMPRIRQLYGQVDDTVYDFLEKFKETIDLPIKGVHNACGQVMATPLEVLTHVMTHEFHHKGQILSMCRLLGHLPPDTDISLAFQSW